MDAWGGDEGTQRALPPHLLPSRRHLRHALAIDRLDTRGDDDTRDRVGDERVSELLEAVTAKRIEL